MPSETFTLFWKKPLLAGVAGGTGSGKTTVVRRLVERLGPQRVAVIQHDAYYQPDPSLSLQQRARINYDHPDSLQTSLLARHLRKLRQGRSVQIPIYDFSRHKRTAGTRSVQPRPLILVEGILVLAEAALRELLDLKVFVSADDDLRFIRRLRRDCQERGRTPESVIHQYLESVRPMHQKFVQPSRAHADLVLAGDGPVEASVQLLLGHLTALVRKRGD